MHNCVLGPCRIASSVQDGRDEGGQEDRDEEDEDALSKFRPPCVCPDYGFMPQFMVIFFFLG